MRPSVHVASGADQAVLHASQNNMNEQFGFVRDHWFCGNWISRLGFGQGPPAVGAWR